MGRHWNNAGRKGRRGFERFLGRGKPRYLMLFLVMLCYIPSAMSAEYVDEAQCQQCHSEQANQWKQSDHRQSMLPADDASVLAPFSGEWFRQAGRELQFYQQQGRYFFRERLHQGKFNSFRITHTLGHYPLQQYVILGEGGQRHVLDIAWDNQKKRWYALSDEHFPPFSRLHWQGQFYRWNTSCADCHSTALDKNYSVESHQYQTRSAQVNIGCQACHGPASKHVDGMANGLVLDHSGFELSWQTLTGQQQAEQCAQCHASRQRISTTHDMTVPFNDKFVLDLLQPGLYFPDGQIRDEVFVYGSFIQSKMHHQGVTCTNCHEPHSGQLKIAGNGLCTQCHNPAGRPDFPTLAPKRYDDAAHHRHDTETEAGLCVSCHMPQTTYMGIDQRRDHQFQIPKPALSAKIGVPSACESCHQASASSEPYWLDWPGEPSEETHYSEILGAAWQAPNEWQQALLVQAQDMQLPAIVRASMLALISPREQGGKEVVLKLLNDESPLVRRQAVLHFKQPHDVLPIERLLPLTQDASLSVRVAVGRVLYGVDVQQLPQKWRALVASTQQEWLTSQSLILDTPEGNMELGNAELERFNLPTAESHYSHAMKLDPDFNAARINLAFLKRATGQSGEAIALLQQAIEKEPENANIHYALAMLYIKQARYQASLPLLERAVELSNYNAKMVIALVLVLEEMKRPEQALAWLNQGIDKHPRHPQLNQLYKRIKG